MTDHDACLSLDLLERLVRSGSTGAGSTAVSGAVIATDADEHLRACAQCRDRLAEMREIDAFISHFARPAPAGVSGETAPPKPHRSDSPSLPPHDEFPGYSIESIVEIGGQGVIHRARQLVTGRVVAIKVPLGDVSRRPARRYRFQREIELTSRLDHPGIVRVFGACEASTGRIGCVMEFVEGRRFDEWAEACRGEGREGLRRIVDAVRLIAEAIAYAHQRGVLHRDLKPSNVLVTEGGRPRVLDFGLAKALDGSGGSFVTVTGAFLGTLAYAAPEQLDHRRDEGDVRTDVFGMGMLLHHALAGRVPWNAEAAPQELCTEIRRGGAARPSLLGGAGDSELDAIVLKAIATEPERRYSSAASFAEDLDRWLTGRPVRARFDSHWYVLRKSAWRGRWWIAAAVMFLCVTAALAWFGMAERSALARASLADAVRDARAVESHWSSISDARAVARDDFVVGEERVWDALLGADRSIVDAGIEGATALGGPLPPLPPSDPSASTTMRDPQAGQWPTGDWSKDVPTSPAYWALAEIYLGTPVVASLPALLPSSATFDAGTDHVLVGVDGAVERWEWRTGERVGRIELGLAEDVPITLILTSGGWACVRSGATNVTLVDLARDTVHQLPVSSPGAISLEWPHFACIGVDGDERRLQLWRLDRGAPQLSWSRACAGRANVSAIDRCGRFVVLGCVSGSLLVFDLLTGDELHRRDRSSVPQYRWIGSRGRCGEVLLWGERGLAAFEWRDGQVTLHRLDDTALIDGEELQHLTPGPRGERYLARLDRFGMAIGHVDEPLEACTRIPGFRAIGNGFSADERHLVALPESAERQAIVDLRPDGVVGIPSPALPGAAQSTTIFQVRFVGDDAALLTGSMDGALRLSTDRSRWTETLVSDHGVTTFEVDGADTYVGTHECGGGDAKLFRLRDGVPELLLDDRRAWYCGIVVDPGATVERRTGAAPGATLWALGGDGRLFRMELSPESPGTESAPAWRPAIAVERDLSNGEVFRALARLTDRRLLIVGARSRTLHLLDDSTLETRAVVDPISAVRDVVVSPTDPRQFVTTHDNGVIRVWRVTDAERSADPLPANPAPHVTLVHEMGAHAGPVFCAAYHPSGRMLATGGGAPETRDVRLWDLDSGRELAGLSLFVRGVFSVTFSPDGRWLAAGGEGVPLSDGEGGQLFLIDLAAVETSIAGNLEYHIARISRDRGGLAPPHAALLRQRFRRSTASEHVR